MSLPKKILLSASQGRRFPLLSEIIRKRPRRDGGASLLINIKTTWKRFTPAFYENKVLDLEMRNGYFIRTK
tara:strand:- start:1334 stop:1546 length:213 start_codon:yes stop_codon:yes gene_type:complete